MLNLLAGFLLEQPLVNDAILGVVVYTAVFSVGIGYTLQVWGNGINTDRCGTHPEFGGCFCGTVRVAFLSETFISCSNCWIRVDLGWGTVGAVTRGNFRVKYC